MTSSRQMQAGLELIAQKAPAVICRGVAMLAQSGRPEAVEALLPLLWSRSEAVSDCARNVLGRMDVAPLLLDWWHGPDAQKQTQAAGYAAALAHSGLMDLYREAARAGTPGLREKAAIGLKRQQPTAEVFRLLADLAADPDKGVRWWAIDSLAAHDSPEAIAILQERRAAERETELKPFIERALRPVPPAE